MVGDGTFLRFTIFSLGFAFLIACSSSRPHAPQDFDSLWRTAQYKTIRAAGVAAIERGDYKIAADEFRSGAQAAQAAGHLAIEARFLANAGAALLAISENKAAIRDLLKARDAAQRAADLATLQSIQANLASLYSMSGDPESASVAALAGAALLPPSQAPGTRIPILLSFARAMARAGRIDAARPLFSEALAIAARQPTSAFEAEVLETWGWETLRSGDLAAAEEMVSRAWTARRRSNDPRIHLTEGKLARLFRLKGNPAIASFWLARNREAVKNGAKLPVAAWDQEAEYARVLQAEGKTADALASWRRAIELARAWRTQVPPAERLRLSAELHLQELFEGYLECGARQLRQRRDPGLEAEMFVAIHSGRAWSLDPPAGKAAPGESLHSSARRLEGRWLSGDRSAQLSLRAVRTAIAESESVTAEAAKPADSDLLEKPEPGTLVLTYWLHEDGSWLWLWNHSGLRAIALGPRSRIVDAATRFRLATAADDSQLATIGGELLDLLLGSAKKEALQANRWDIVADEGLYHVPFAALPVGSGYLAESIQTRFVPNALTRGRPAAGHRRFMAVADPVFNRADDRQTVHAAHWLLELPRLPGTRKEAETARAAWGASGFETNVLMGPESSEEIVLERISAWQPSIIHIASHTVAPADDPDRPRLALSLRSDGSPGLLAADDIAALRIDADLVVLSACRSAGAQAVKGAGLLGLTRAWLTAGSRNVVATLWPVGDDAGQFFARFHGTLAHQPNVFPMPAAAALRQAQIDCIRAGGSQAKPSFWAAHVLLARR